MTEQEMKEFTDKWLPCWEGGKPQAAKLIEFYHEEAELVDPNHVVGLKGRSELLSFFEQMLEIYPDWKFDVEELIATADGFVFLYRVDIPFKGKVFENFRGVDVMKMKDGLIISHKGYYDRTPIVLYKQELEKAGGK
ncbi:nuclear transport factor 2 family protein [Candidatus Uabimicrobium sp. HlEnr_7]|uniref:nuclear transport factor 2 family protein n=1 Tax=Candidatus Uabimicrobium helgolandensis TaxID=3095367 RepID=UPI0035568139